MFIIDEVSIVASLNLAYIHLGLEELFGGNKWFGTCCLLVIFSNYIQAVSGDTCLRKDFPKICLTP